MKASPDVILDSVGQCIYCWRKPPEFPLTTEHIIPFAVGGNQLLPEASCGICQKATSRFEMHCARVMFQTLRIHHNVQTRRPKQRPKEITVIDGATPHGAPIAQIDAALAPGIAIFPDFAPPGILIGSQPSPWCPAFNIATYLTTPDADARQKALVADGMSGAIAYGEFQPFEFGKLLAKIAHGVAVAAYGVDAFEHYLPGVILGGDPHVFHYVGGATIGQLPAPTPEISFHQVAAHMATVGGDNLLLVVIRLFSHMRPLTPVYEVVAGKIRT